MKHIFVTLLALITLGNLFAQTSHDQPALQADFNKTIGEVSIPNNIIGEENGKSEKAMQFCKIEQQDALQIIVPLRFKPEETKFRVESNSIHPTELSIFDQWGNLVFTTKDGGKGWDGMKDGKLVDKGVYAYVVKAKHPNGAVQKGSGCVVVE